LRKLHHIAGSEERRRPEAEFFEPEIGPDRGRRKDQVDVARPLQPTVAEGRGDGCMKSHQENERREVDGEDAGADRHPRRE
jgi:hypothetical protein